MKEKAPKRRRSRLKRNGINPTRFDSSQLKFYAYLIPVGIIMALPIIFIFMNAFKPLDELFAYPPRFYVKRPTMDNFAMLFQMSSNTNVPVSRYLFNSIVSTAVVVFATLGIAVAAGYVFSKKRFKLKNGLFNLNTLALMFVPTAVAIPRYFVIVYSGMLDNFLAHILPLLAMPVGLFLIKQFVDQIPNALVEAAVIDGASDYTILVKIIVPMVAPALATVAMMAFQGAWNATEASTLFINNESLKNFAFYMSTLSNTGTNAVAGAGVAAAAGLIMFLPNLILFIILQSRVMNTMAHSGIK
jgi:ABC-type glycerol-3-phosphate transport system permease component